ncbi:MAG: DUF2779 domain-containing protein [Candidatus Saccharimonadales bacterium]
MYLSKSDFLKYRACPSYFWLWKHNPAEVPDESSVEVRDNKFEQGNQVETIARQLFPTGKLVDGYNVTAKANTERLVADGAEVLFQATVITDDDLLAMADVLEKHDDCWILYEVKSSSSVKKDKHIPDMAFQKTAFEKAGYTIKETRIIHLNKEFVRHGDTIDPNKYFVIENVDEYVAKILPEVRDQIALALDRMRDTAEPTACPCRQLSRSNHCPPFSRFNPDIPEYSVYNIARMNGKKLESLIDDEIFHTTDIPDAFSLTPNQAMQVAVDKSGQPRIDKDKIQNELSALEYPLYFIDYESVNPAIPLLDGTHPHQQVVFQYSLHILDSPDSDLQHTEHLCRESSLESLLKLVKQMREDIGDAGSVIVWNKVFERGRNTELGELFPEFKSFFEGVNERIYDLMDVFSKNYYVDPGFHGSNSIKDVLPVLAPQLSYKDLEIGKGDLASVRWYEIVTNEDTAGADQVFNDLLAYCKLDTLAMVEIYKRLVESTQ